MSLTCLQNQLTESSENSKTTLEKGGRNPPDVKLDFVLEDLLKYLSLCETKKEIERKYNIVKEHDDCWSEDDIKRAWGKTQRMDDDKRRNLWALVIVKQVLKRQRTKEEDSEERSTQRKAELKPLEAAGGDMQSSGGNHPTSSYLCQTSCASQATGNGAPDAESGVLECVKNMIIEDEIMCIRIPILEMFHNEPTAGDHSVQYVPSRYKLINGFPSDNIVSKTRSYAMSFDNYTRNAEWVYEILNSETVVDNCEPLEDFGQAYVKGHLAAVANHRWCREAHNDTNVFSNIIPQNSELNNSRWKALEKRCRIMANNIEIRNVHVYTGPLYWRPMNDSESSRSGGKIVPTHLFKVIIVEKKDGTVGVPKCYVMPNEIPKHEDLAKYEMDINTFQRDSGLTFVEYRLRDRERDRIKTMRLQGEDLNQTRRYVNIGVRITHNVNQ